MSDNPDPFLVTNPDPFTGTAPARPSLLRQIPAQFVAGALRSPVDVTFGLAGALGSSTSKAIAEGYGNNVDNLMGTTEPNWRTDTSEFVARNLGGAAVGLPLRALNALGMFRNTTSPLVRATEAVTPLTLPMNPTNYAINAIAGNVIGVGFQEAQRYEQSAQQELAANPDPFVMDTGPTTQQRMASGNADPFMNAETPQQPATLVGRAMEYVPHAVAGLAVLAGGGAAVRQIAQNRAATAAMDGGNVSQSQATTNNYQPGFVEQAANATVDNTTIAQNSAQRMATDGIIPQAQATALRESFGVNIHAAPVMEQAQEMINTGRVLDTGIVMPAPQRIIDEVVALGQRDVTLYRVLNDALAAGDELDSRKMINNNPNPSLQPQSARFLASRETGNEQTLIGTNGKATLFAQFEAGRANPQVRAIMDQMQEVNRGMREFAVREGLYDAATARKLASTHPNYVHNLDPDNSAFTRRDMSEKTPEQIIDPMASMIDTVRQYTIAALNNRQKVALIDAAQAMNRVTPDGTKLYGVGRVGLPAQLSKNIAPGMQLVKAKVNGQDIAVEVLDIIAASYRTSPRATAPILSGIANFIRETIVGRFGVIGGYMQAPISAAFGASALIGSRPKGTSAGLIDKLMLNTTGRNLPIGDLTFGLQMSYAGFKGVVAELSGAMGRELNRSILRDTYMSKALGPAKAQALSTRLNAIYMDSEVALARQFGSVGTGVSYNPAHMESLKLAALVADPGYSRLLPKDRAAVGMNAVNEHLAFYGRQATPEGVHRLWNLAGSMLEVISSAHTLAYTAQNKANMPAAQLHATARRLAGDPAARGGNPFTQQVLSAIPFANTTIQGIRAHQRALRENPTRWVATYTGAAASLALLSLTSAMFADEQEGGNRHVEHLMAMPGREASSGGFIFVPGIDPRNSMRIPMDPTTAFLVGGAQGIVAQLMGVPEAIANGTLGPLRDSLNEFMSARTKQATLEGAMSGFNLLEPAFNIAGGIFGTGRGALDVGAPGYERGRLYGTSLDADVGQRIKSFTGILGQQVVTFAERFEITKDMRVSMRSWVEDFSSRQRIAGPLLQGVRTDSPNGMIGEVVRPYEDKFAAISRGYGDVVRPGTVGSGIGVRAAMTGRAQPPADIIPIIATMNALNSGVSRLRQDREGYRQAIVDIQSNPQRFPNEGDMRRAINEESARIRRTNSTLYNIYKQSERELSRSTGRRIDFSRLNPERGLDQFALVRP